MLAAILSDPRLPNTGAGTKTNIRLSMQDVWDHIWMVTLLRA